MIDFTKYKLKGFEELTDLIDDFESVIVLSCNKCFKTFNTKSCLEPEHDELTEFLVKEGKNVVLSERVDFLCNKYKTGKLLAEIDSSASILVVACGFGTQTVAALSDFPVYTACDSLASGMNHAVSLNKKLCFGCNQCFLSKTNGICPVVDCPKGILNGGCGGSKDGKCEVNPENDCTWVKILSKNFKDFGFFVAKNKKSANSVIFDHSKSQCTVFLTLAENIRRKRLESYYGGLYPKDQKYFSAFLTLETFLTPDKVTIPLSQHAGNSADLIVSVGDYVKVGQKIGEAVGILSSSVHASVSGIITDVIKYRHPNSSDECLLVKIESDGKNELCKSVIPIPYWDDLDIYDIDAIIAEKGIVGMGGAGFPTPVKLKSPKPIDTILLNGCESEPYITADHRIMLEKTDDMLLGLQIILKCTGAERGIIVVSDNKSDVIAHLEEKIKDFDDIFVMALWSKYPQGAERTLIARTLGRHLLPNQRPYDVGAIVLNVSTARAIGDAFTTGMPLIERAVTVSGEKIRRHGNFMVRIGTSVQDLLDHCGIVGNTANEVINIPDSNTKIMLGGPMMGKIIEDLHVPIIKGTNAVIAVQNEHYESYDCIRCGRCVDACPMELLPLNYPVLESDKLQDDFYRYLDSYNTDVSICVECGCCDYVCPSKIKIVDSIKRLKVMDIKR
ncbi:MAG: electron transport complex subunit RsxC [Oscillospiraceae bacterium]|jgi:electron transport complex protein RnfC|nr:electron transport complex subunit RsxC [Oscillospiraceae bacterium]